MAFCNSCGTTLSPGAKFCNKCGAVITGTAAATPSTPAPSPSTGGNNALKIILIVVVVIVGLGILATATLTFLAHRFVAHNIHVSQNGDQVKVDTPFGRVETTKDPQQAARNLGVDIYPGAQVQSNGTATTTFGAVHTVAANFESNDPVDKICDFYKSRFPNAMVTTSSGNRCTIISNDQKNMITINIESSGAGTKLQITNVSKASDAPN